MGCFKPQTEEKRNNNEIEKQISQWHKQYTQAIKLLLLGTGESGKTTIIKQMKILHISGFTESERRASLPHIWANVHESICDIVRSMSQLQPPIHLAEAALRTNVSFLLGLQEEPQYDTDYFSQVSALWKDAGVQECYRRSNEYQLIDCAKYFLDKLVELQQPDYIPTEQDILFCRKRTSGIQKIEFTVNVSKSFGGGSQNFWMFDVGGQRSERHKWIQVFEGIQAILFVVASSDFDQTLRESSDTNRLEEALILFDDVWNSRFLRDAGFIVFLNKQDTLRSKVESGKNIGQYFAQYRLYQPPAADGSSLDEYTRTKCFIRDMFMDVSRQRRSSTQANYVRVGAGFSVPLLASEDKRQCYYHYTVATDSGNIRTVFNDVHSMLITKNLNMAGLQ